MTTVSFRPAALVDTPMAAQLIYASMERSADYVFSSDDPAKTKGYLAKLFVQPRNVFSYDIAEVALLNGQAVGLLASYPGRLSKQLELPTGLQLVKVCGLGRFVRFVRRIVPLSAGLDTQADEYYLETVSVLADFHGMGIGTQLLLRAEAKAQAEGLHKCSLGVEIGNDRAQRLYEHMGYRIVNSTKPDRSGGLSDPKGFHRMVKALG